MKRAWPISVRFAVLAFVPITIALVVGLTWFRSRVQDSLDEGLSQSIAETEKAQTAVRLDARQQRLNLLSAVAENASLKAVATLWRESSGDSAAGQTVQELLLELAGSLEADLVAFRDADGRAVSAVARGRGGSGSRTLASGELPQAPRYLATVAGQLFELLAVPVNTGSENLGSLVVGKRFDPASFHPQAVLLESGRVAATAGLTAGQQASGEVERAFASCGKSRQRCPVTLGGVRYLALAMDQRLLDAGFELWTLHSVENAASQLMGTATQGLWMVLAVLLAAALLADIFGARAVAKPLVALVDRLQESERKGVLQGDFPEDSSTREVNELAHAFNLAARSVADAQRRLDEAYLQITQTMAHTLDARDPYTAGHSNRVSEYAVEIAKAMNLSAGETDIIRVGASLHDIGKIGIPDAVLQKPGPLTTDEFEVIKNHPIIGKRILEGVAKFHDYLSIVELHHENQDGSGYPWGLVGDSVPLGARIVHVVDAYDAMTTNRPYRKAMAPAAAQEILRRHGGRQFDPAVVEVFLRLVRSNADSLPADTSSSSSASTAEIGPQLAALELRLDPAPIIERHEMDTQS